MLADLGGPRAQNHGAGQRPVPVIRRTDDAGRSIFQLPSIRPSNRERVSPRAFVRLPVPRAVRRQPRRS